MEPIEGTQLGQSGLIGLPVILVGRTILYARQTDHREPIDQSGSHHRAVQSSRTFGDVQTYADRSNTPILDQHHAIGDGVSRYGVDHLTDNGEVLGHGQARKHHQGVHCAPPITASPPTA